MDHILSELGLPADDVPTVSDYIVDDPKFPDNWDGFYKFPHENGWALDKDYKLISLRDTVPTDKDKRKFLQSWLFFGLIMTVVQEDGRSILEYKELVKVEGNERRVTTELLPTAIQRWKDWEDQEHGDKKLSDVRLRMVRIESVLNIARRTIQTNFVRSSSTGSPEDDILVLSLMILGETLSLSKARIMKSTQSGLKGWHVEDGGGWGPPTYILVKMAQQSWCPRTIHLWQSQFRYSATLILSSYLAYNNAHNRFNGVAHNDCTTEDCYVTSKDTQNGKYVSAHAYGCKQEHCLSMEGPNMVKIRDLLREGVTPLLQFEKPHSGIGQQDKQSGLGLKVLRMREDENDQIRYATISHVWSDGFGNEDGNTLPCCQLRNIRKILDKREQDAEGWQTPFWMDTLIIPVGTRDEDKRLRKTAISQIFDVFKQSAFTIVLDAGLSQLTIRAQEKPARTAMRILGSSWMRRLWTLQEAFVSRKIYFAFEEAHHPSLHLPGVDELSQRLGAGSDTEMTTALLDMVNDHLRHLIMSHEYETRDKYLFPKDKGDHTQSTMDRERMALLVASSWKAARWRRTTNMFHETWALATLLNLTYENTDIGEAGLKQTSAAQRPTNKEEREQVNEKDRLVKLFWTQFDNSWKKSIPPGIIFLSDDRVDREGFGWAPRTWMTAQPVDHPDPLTLMNSTAELSDKLDGLKVQFPGFLLHPQDRNHILSADKLKQGKFWFPTGPSFLDWYVVEPAGGDISQTFLPDMLASQNRLGIIVSRTRPGDDPAEIGLLVQIREERMGAIKPTGPSMNGIDGHQTVPTLISSRDTGGTYGEAEHLYCAIIRRVKVSRETRPEFRTRNDRLVAPQDAAVSEQDKFVVHDIMANLASKQVCLAEELGSTQVWYVDGYFLGRDAAPKPTPVPVEIPNNESRKGILSTVIGPFRRKQDSNSQHPSQPSRAASMALQQTSDSQSETVESTRKLSKRTTWTFGIF